MIGYATIGSNDLDRAKAFYDAVLAPLGGRRTMSYERMQFYGNASRGAMFAICRPFDGEVAAPGNGAMLALAAPDEAAIGAVYAAAIANGGGDEGPPGQRDETFYGAYFRDLDGNKVCVFKSSL